MSKEHEFDRVVLKTSAFMITLSVILSQFEEIEAAARALFLVLTPFFSIAASMAAFRYADLGKRQAKLALTIERYLFFLGWGTLAAASLMFSYLQGEIMPLILVGFATGVAIVVFALEQRKS